MPLAPYAMEVGRSAGRRHLEPPHPYRTPYQRDRDRIIHARAFRRLEDKTQVFTRRYSDHFRNRLTHTLEVTQIARTVAGALDLNSDLCEALALVHDIGHPPFGHAGEGLLDRLMRARGDFFDHNLHALRIVERFEQRYAAFPGLNLTFEVREGIIKHSRHYPPAEHPELADYRLEDRPLLEAQVIDLADEIAYNAADLDDSFEARLLGFDEMNQVPLLASLFEEVDRLYPGARPKLRFNEVLKRLIDRLTTDLVEHTRRRLDQHGIASPEAVRRHPERLVSLSPEMKARNRQLKEFLFQRLYQHPSILEERERAVAVLEELFEAYLAHPERLPRPYQEETRRLPLHRVVCDYLAGMTDNYVFRIHAEVAAAPTPRS